MSLEVVILAAGKGKRMHSMLPKVLHKVANKPMLQHVIESAYALNPKAIHVVVGHMSEKVEQMIVTLPENIKSLVKVAHQTEQLGTGHAVACAMGEVSSESNVLVLYGDTPLTPVSLLNDLVNALADKALCVLSAIAPNPFGYGRIIRNEKNSLQCIVEEKDATDEQREVTEVSLMVAPDFDILSGVNSKPQLAFGERLYQENQAKALMDAGVTLADPKRFDLRGTLKCGEDVFIDINCIFEGNVVLGNDVVIGAGCVIKNMTIGDGSIISPYSVLEDSEVKRKATIGPFARLRPGNVLEDEVHVGNFVECKKSHLGLGTKAGHLSYLGDAQIGKDVNIGAGTITCNYDGANKFKTIIGDDVFIGSDSQLVAPCEVKSGVTVAAGTTVTRRTITNEGALILTRAETIVKENYPRPHKKK